MATKFYRAAGEQSDDDDDDRSDAGDGSDEDTPKPTTAAAKPAAGAKPTTAAAKPVATAVAKKSSMFGDKKLNVGSDDDDSDGDSEKRKVISAKEKKMSALLAAIKAMRNAQKIGNWVKVLAEWEAIDKHLEKLMKEPEFRKEGVPKVYWQQLLGLETLIRKQKDDEKKAKAGNDDGKDSKKAPAPKKINADQARAQTRLHSNLKKLIKQYEKQLTEYMKAPLAEDLSIEDAAAGGDKKKADDDDDGDDDDGDDDADGDEDDDDDGGDVKGMAAAKSGGGSGSKGGKASAAAAKTNDDGDDDDEEWDEDSSDDDTTADVIDLTKATGKQFTREYWMKKPGAPDSDDEDFKQKKPKEKRKQGTAKTVTDADAEREAAEKKKKDAKPEVEFTPEVIMKRLTELVAMRGRKGTDRQMVISDLKLLSTKTTEPAPLLKVYITLCSALFDVTLNADTHMPIALWQQANETLTAIIKLLMKEPLVRLSEDDTAVEESFETGENEDQKIIEKYITSASAAKVEEEAKKKADEEKALKAEGKEIQYVMGNLYSFVDRMAAEYKRSLQNIDPHGPDYVTRMKDEAVLLALIERVQEYYFKIAKITYQCKVVLLRLEHVYYHYTPADDVQRSDAQAYVAAIKAGKPAPTPSSSSNSAGAGAGVSRTPFGTRGFLNIENPAQVQQLATFLYKHADDRTRMRALLYHVYYLSIHNRYAEARDLLLMSHVQDGINEVDIYTRIIFNRTMAQLGMCAFRVGEYRHALYCLMDLHQSKSIKELIAQGTSSRFYGERDADKEKMERKRVYPYHQHMSLDMLESIHLLSAMLIEVPNFALYGADNKRKLVSKIFRRLFDHHQRQAFNGPPENTRDLIMGSAKALRAGEWAKSLKYVMRLKFWELLPNAEYVKSMVTDQLKSEALRTYLCTFATQYVTISLAHLKSTFELADNVVYRITSKMMVNEQLQGTWDQPSACIVMHAQEPTPLQRAALKYADKASSFLEQNERAGEQRAALGAGDGSGERRSGYGGYGSGYQRAGGDSEGGDHPTGRRTYRGGRGGGRLGPGNRMRVRGGGGGGDRRSDD